MGALGEEELLSHASTLEAIFAHYANAVRLAPASTAAAPSFWEELRLEKAALGVADDGGDSGGGGGRGGGGSVSAVDLAGWQRMLGHFGVCPTLLSKAELGRIFQQEAHRAPPANHFTFPQFAHALGVVAHAAFPFDEIGGGGAPRTAEEGAACASSSAR